MTGRQRLIPLSERDSWEEAVAGVPHAFAHTWAYCRAMHYTSGWPTYLYTWEDGASSVVCAVAERGTPGYVDVVTPYGFGGFVGRQVGPAVLEDWARLAQERGWVCGYLGLNPLLVPPVIRHSRDYTEHNEVHVLDLRRGPEALFGALSTNRRRQVRAFERGEARSITDADRLRTFFLGHVDQFLRSRGATPTYAFVEATYDELLEGEDVLLLGVEDRDGQVVSAALFGFTAHCGDYLFGISLPHGQRWSAVMVWMGVVELAARGIPYLNLGGGVRPGDGVAEFKERFGGAPLPLGALKQVYRPHVYAELCRQAGVEADDRSRFFPAYREPGLIAPSHDSASVPDGRDRS
jgi:hypothetical protein